MTQVAAGSILTTWPGLSCLTKAPGVTPCLLPLVSWGGALIHTMEGNAFIMNHIDEYSLLIHSYLVLTDKRNPGLAGWVPLSHRVEKLLLFFGWKKWKWYSSDLSSRTIFFFPWSKNTPGHYLEQHIQHSTAQIGKLSKGWLFFCSHMMVCDTTWVHILTEWRAHNLCPSICALTNPSTVKKKKKKTLTPMQFWWDVGSMLSAVSSKSFRWHGREIP